MYLNQNDCYVSQRKAYWVVHTDVTDCLRFFQYQEAFYDILDRLGGTVIAQEAQTTALHGRLRHRTTIIAFDSRVAAFDCYQSCEFQSVLALFSSLCEFDMTIVDALQFEISPDHVNTTAV